MCVWQATPDKASRATLFTALEEWMGVSEPQVLLPLTMPLLHSLYEAELFDEAFLQCWYESVPETSLTVPRAVAVDLRARALPFIDWLRYYLVKLKWVYVWWYPLLTGWGIIKRVGIYYIFDFFMIPTSNFKQ